MVCRSYSHYCINLVHVHVLLPDGRAHNQTMEQSSVWYNRSEGCRPRPHAAQVLSDGTSARVKCFGTKPNWIAWPFMNTMDDFTSILSP